MIEEEFSAPFSKCINDWRANYGPDEPEYYGFVVAKVVGGQVLCTVSAIDRHSGFFAALAAFIVAFFTYTLDRATNRLWRIEDRNFRVAQRAFVSLDGFNYELSTAANTKKTPLEGIPERYRDDPGLYITRFAALPKLKNAGNTPTRNMTVQMNWRGPNGTLPPEYTYDLAPRGFFLAPHATEVIGEIEIPPAGALIDWSFSPWGKPPPLILIWGRADYEDAFGGKHFVEWCRSLRFERHDGKEMRAGFIQWGDYNRSDDS